jgi:hypothetical protein
MPKCNLFVVSAMILLFTSMSIAQVHTVTASNEVALPGASATVKVTLDNEEAARGFSIGLAHTGTILTLTAISSGAEVADSNGGAGPDFEFIDLTAAG